MNMSPDQHFHLIGASGAGMRSLADYLLSSGKAVSGSDQHWPPELKTHFAFRGMKIMSAHDEELFPLRTTNVVHSLAIPHYHAELKAGRERGLVIESYIEHLGHLTRNHQTVGIAGTHGKTTTSAMLNHILNIANLHASSITGGKIAGSSVYGWKGTSDWLVTECCEFRESFVQLTPKIAVVLNIEPDHFDCFPDFTMLKAAFEKFCGKLPHDGLLVLNGDDGQADLLAACVECEVIRFGLDVSDKANNVAVSILDRNSSGTRFELNGCFNAPEFFTVPLPGRHQVVNATAAILLASRMGLQASDIERALRNFPGVDRRMQIRMQTSSCVVIDDYAHHPSEITATYKALKQKYPCHRLVVAFQPHQIMRTERLMDEFANSLAPFDEILILPIFAAREVVNDRCEEVSCELVRRIGHRESNVVYCPTLDAVRLKLEDAIEKQNDATPVVMATMGAGDIDRIYDGLSGTFC